MRKELRKRTKIHLYTAKVLLNNGDEFPNRAQLTRSVGDASRKGLSVRGDACLRDGGRAGLSAFYLRVCDDLGAGKWRRRRRCKRDEEEGDRCVDAPRGPCAIPSPGKYLHLPPETFPHPKLQVRLRLGPSLPQPADNSTYRLTLLGFSGTSNLRSDLATQCLPLEFHSVVLNILFDSERGVSCNKYQQPS